jgi:hypothetical protein
METASIFEQASRLKLKYASKQGDLSTEDLWDLPLTITESDRRFGNRASLDEVAVAIHNQIEAAGKVSFVVKKTSATEILQIKLDIVKHIIAFKQAEATRKQKEAAAREQKAKLLEIRERKQSDAMGNLSIEEIDAMLAGLEEVKE